MPHLSHCVRFAFLLAAFFIVFSGAAWAQTTQTFSNASSITINDASPASPYPSEIEVTGFLPGSRITNVTVTIADITHTYPGDVGFLLVSPSGATVLLTDRCGGGDDLLGVAWTFDDAAMQTLFDSTATGAYRPTQCGAVPLLTARGDKEASDGIAPSSTFSPPAPAPSYGTTMSVFNDGNPNGTWKLFVEDFAGSDIGEIAGGWSITITAAVPDYIVTTDQDNESDGCGTGECTLREAIEAANANPASPETIGFSSFFDVPRTITLNGNELLITDETVIAGPGANKLTVSGNNASRVFGVAPFIKATISDLTAANGNGSGANDIGSGGGIACAAGGTLTLNRVEVSNNSASFPGMGSGGGIFTGESCTLNLTDSVVAYNQNAVFQGAGMFIQGNATIIRSSIHNNSGVFNGAGIYFSSQAGLSLAWAIVNSTISSNSTGAGDGNGGGIFAVRQSNNASEGTLNLNSVTIADNTVQGGSGRGGGLYNCFQGGVSCGSTGTGLQPVTVNAINTIIARNFAQNGGNDIFATEEAYFTSSGNNLIGDNAGAPPSFVAGMPNVNGDFVGTNAAPLNPGIAPLGNYGSPSGSYPQLYTHALYDNSVALNNGGGKSMPPTDQRGAARPSGLGFDIGAFESSDSFRGSVPDGRVNVPYSETIVPDPGMNSYCYFGSLPPGITGLNPCIAFQDGKIIADAGRSSKRDSAERTGALPIVLSGTPTMAGTYNFDLFISSPTDGGSSVITNMSMTVAPAATAATVGVSGQVVAGKYGVSDAVVSLTDSRGETIIARANSFGYYAFESVMAGETYTLTVTSKRYFFQPRAITINDELTGLIITAE